MSQSGCGSVRAERGIALLSALFTVALLTVIVIEMTDATMVHTHLTRNAGNAVAAQLLARSAAIAGEALVSDKTTNPPDVTCDKNVWASPIPGYDVGDGMVALQITDEGGKLDLNSVRNQAYGQAVEKLFTTLDLDPSLVGKIATWITPPTDGAMATGGASDYCALAMCAPRQQPLNSLDELLLIRGFNEQTIALLRPYVTAIPRTDSRAAGAPLPVNALTAKQPVLAALGCDGGDQVPACPQSFGSASDSNSKEWQTKYSDWQTKNCKAVTSNQLGTKSSFFAIDAIGVVGDMEQRLRVLVQRTGKGVKRLWWQERPVSDALPVEVR